jgi:hypothetical protein
VQSGGEVIRGVAVERVALVRVGRVALGRRVAFRGAAREGEVAVGSSATEGLAVGVAHASGLCEALRVGVVGLEAVEVVPAERSSSDSAHCQRLSTNWM